MFGCSAGLVGFPFLSFGQNLVYLNTGCRTDAVWWFFSSSWFRFLQVPFSYDPDIFCMIRWRFICGFLQSRTRVLRSEILIVWFIFIIEHLPASIMMILNLMVFCLLFIMLYMQILWGLVLGFNVLSDVKFCRKCDMIRCFPFFFCYQVFSFDSWAGTLDLRLSLWIYEI